MPPLPVSARPRSPPRVGRPWVVLFLLFAAFACVAGAAADAGRRRFDIPAGAAVTTIKRTALQAGLEIVYSATVVQGVQTPAVVGEFRPREGIERLLAGTGLRLVEDKQTGVLSISCVPAEQPKARPPDSISPRNGNSETTQQNPAPMKSRTLFALLAGRILAGPALDAQTTSSPPLEEVVTLSPFTVNAQEDKGYRASSTLAGSRLKTSLKDLSGGIQVVTEQFLKDTGSTDSTRLLLYTTNTEVAGNDGNFSGNNGGTDDSGVRRNASPTVRVRGFSSADLTRGYFLSDIDFEAYNTDRITISRGPNGMLFGLGSPGGIMDAGLERKSPIEAKSRVIADLFDC